LDEKITALYARVSTEAQAQEGYSIAAQIEKLESICTLRDYKNHDAYIDGGQSGSNLDRPQMQRLIRHACQGMLSHVIVYKLDRLSRSQKDTLYLIEDVFIPNSIDFISINENIDTTTPYGRAMIGILSAFAQLERENIFMRTRAGMTERVRGGLWMGGGRVPFGYDYDRENGVLVPNADAVKVKQIYELYIQGYAPGKIALMLGLKYDRLVTQILRRKSNTGVIVYNGVEYPGRHMPIISVGTYELAMQKMKERSKARTANGTYLLSGICYCGVCGAKMRYQKWGSAGVKLICYSRDKSKPHMVMDSGCLNESVWAQEVERVVLDDLFRLSCRISAEDLPGEAPGPLELLDGQEKHLVSKIKRLYNLYAETGNELLLEIIRENEGKYKALSDELEAEKQQHEHSRRLSAVRNQILGIRESWPHMSLHEKQAVIRDCIGKIVIQSKDVSIYYTFHNEQA